MVAGLTAALVVGSSDNSKPKTNTAHQNVNAGCGPYRKDGVVSINGRFFNVETVGRTADLVKGLSGRPCILPNWGMLFDFHKEGQYAIWMKDMKFPIDVIWISSQNSVHKIVAITIDFKPSTYNYNDPKKSVRWGNQIPARYVLELKANTAKDLHLALGTPVHFQKS